MEEEISDIDKPKSNDEDSSSDGEQENASDSG
jgi:hypothetical protein